MVTVFAEVKRVLRGDGTLWLNIGDSYARMQEGNVPQSKNKDCQPPIMRGRVPNAGLKPKDLVGIPWMLAFALRADGWYLRSDIIWHKPNPMPESVTDRPTKSHEYIFLLTKSAKYFYDAQAIREPMETESGWAKQRSQGINTWKYSSKADVYGLNGKETDGDILAGRNKRSVWTVATAPYSEAHFATFPPKLIEPCILAGSKEGDTVLDPFSGAATTGLVAKSFFRRYIGIELNENYIKLSMKRLSQEVLAL